MVASEVKSLANQTAKATEEIAQQIGQIQAATKQAVEAIHGITGDDRGDERDFHRHRGRGGGAGHGDSGDRPQRASDGGSTRDVTLNIVGVSQAAAKTGAAAEQLLSAAANLSRQAEQLTSEIGSFIAEVRAA